MQQEGEKKLSKGEIAIVAGLIVGILVLIVAGIALMVTRGSERGDSAIFGQIFSEDDADKELHEVDKPIGGIDYEDDDQNDNKVAPQKYVFRDGREAFEDNELIFNDDCSQKVENEGLIISGEEVAELQTLADSYAGIERIYEMEMLDYEDRGDERYLYVKKVASNPYQSYYVLERDIYAIFTPALRANLIGGKDALYKSGRNGEILIDMESSRLLSATAFTHRVENGRGINVVAYDGKHALVIKSTDYLVNPNLPADDNNMTRVRSAFEAKKVGGQWVVSRSYRYCAGAL